MNLLRALTFLILMLLSVSSSTAQVNIISRDSTVDAIELFFDGPGEEQFERFLGEGTFNSTATANSILASQNSTVTALGIEIDTFTDAGLLPREGLMTIVATGIDVEFDVTSTTFYSLQGVVVEETFGPDGSNFGNVFVELESDTTDVFTIFNDPDTQTDFSSSGLLSPGNYTFHLSSVYSAGSTTPGAITSSTVSLAFTPVSVPEPSSTYLFGIAVLAVGFRRRKR